MFITPALYGIKSYTSIIAQLLKGMGMESPAVLAFVDQLQKYEILEVCNMVNRKVVHLKPSIFSSGLSPTPGG